MCQTGHGTTSQEVSRETYICCLPVFMVFEPQFPHYAMKTKILSSLSNRDFKTIPNNNWKHTNIQSNKHVEGITVVILRGSHTIRPTAFSL